MKNPPKNINEKLGLGNVTILRLSPEDETPTSGKKQNGYPAYESASNTREDVNHTDSSSLKPVIENIVKLHNEHDIVKYIDTVPDDVISFHGTRMMEVAVSRRAKIETAGGPNAEDPNMNLVISAIRKRIDKLSLKGSKPSFDPTLISVMKPHLLQ